MYASQKVAYISCIHVHCKAFILPGEDPYSAITKNDQKPIFLF